MASLLTDQVGEAQARLGREQQQRVMAASEPCRSIRSGKDRLDLGRGMADQADKAAHRLAPG